MRSETNHVKWFTRADLFAMSVAFAEPLPPCFHDPAKYVLGLKRNRGQAT
jgi:hypothetical protein